MEIYDLWRCIVYTRQFLVPSWNQLKALVDIPENMKSLHQQVLGIEVLEEKDYNENADTPHPRSQAHHRRLIVFPHLKSTLSLNLFSSYGPGRRWRTLRLVFLLHAGLPAVVLHALPVAVLRGAPRARRARVPRGAGRVLHPDLSDMRGARAAVGGPDAGRSHGAPRRRGLPAPRAGEQALREAGLPRARHRAGAVPRVQRNVLLGAQAGGGP